MPRARPLCQPAQRRRGSLRQKDPKVTASRDLATFLYAVADTAPLHVDSQHEFLSWLRDAGFSVNPTLHAATPPLRCTNSARKPLRTAATSTTTSTAWW